MSDNLHSTIQETFKKRELEILRLIANGWSNRQIANELYLSVNTVRWYNKQLYAKLDVQNRTMAVARARAIGLLENEDKESAPESSPPSQQTVHQLPTPPTPFVGREVDILIVTTLLGDPTCRLLSLVGAGGMGKTRLAIEIATRVKDMYADGVVFANLSAISAVEDIIPTIAQAIDFLFGENDSPKKQLFNHLEGHHLLLILDNLEHLSDGIPIISELLTIAPDVKILATSRESLHLREETLYRVEGLEVAPSDENAGLDQSSAVQLFLQQARHVQPEFKLDDATLEAVIEICDLVDGMPLGIELAAAWIAILSPQEIALEIRRSYAFLESDMRNMPQRHRSMRVVFESAWQLLSREERLVLGKLSVFKGGCSRNAAEYVTQSNLRTLMALVNKSLLYRDENARFHLHELLRQYADEQLGFYGHQDESRAMHSLYYLTMLHHRKNEIWDVESESFLLDFDNDFENVRSAWQWAIGQRHFNNIELALESAYQYCIRRNRLYEGLKLLDSAIAQILLASDDTSIHAFTLKLYEYRGRIRVSVGQFEGALSDFEIVHAAPTNDNDQVLELEMMVQIGQVLRRMDRHEDAKRQLEHALEIARNRQDEPSVAEVLYHLGTVFWGEGNNAIAYGYHQESVEICERLGLEDSVAMLAYHGMGESEWMAANFEAAFALTTRSLDLSRKLGNRSYEAENFQNMGWMSVGTLGIGDYEQALNYTSQSLEISQTAHLEWHNTATLNGRGLIAAAFGDYGRGIEMLRECRQLAEGIGARRFLTATLDTLGTLYQELNLWEEAEKLHQQGIEIAIASGAMFWLPRLEANYATDQLRQGNLEVGISLKRAAQTAADWGQLKHRVRCLEGLAEWALLSGNPSLALEYANELLEFAESHGMREMEAQGYRWSCEAYMALGKFREAELAGQEALTLGNAIGRVRLLWDVHAAMATLYRKQNILENETYHQSQMIHYVDKIAASLDDEALKEALPTHL